MASTLVATKLSAPRLRGALVPRPRLTALMDAGAEATLTLVSAPAGFGKTTVLASWLARASTEPRTVAFVSLDESDSHAASFWLYVVTALDSAAPGVGASVLPLLAAGQPATRTLLTAVLNEVGAQPSEVDLILDDYHLADGPEVAEGMTFLLDHRPPNLHVVVSTRADPNLPLARLRARGELVEIRARDLRFTVDGDRDLPDRRRRPARRSGRGVGPRVPDRRVGGSAAAGGPVDAGPGRRRRLHRRVRRDRSIRRRLPRGRGAVPPVRRGPRLPGADVDPRPARRGPVRRRPRTDRQPGRCSRGWSARTCSWCRWTTSAAGTGTTTCSPTSSRRTCAASDPTWSRGFTCAPAAGTTGPASPSPRCATHWPQATSTGPPISSRRPPPPCGATGRRPRSGAGSTTSRTRSSRARPVLAVGFVGALMSSNEFGDVERRLREIERQLPAIQARLAPDGEATAGLGRQVVAVDDTELARVPSAVELYWAGLSLVSGDLPGDAPPRPTGDRHGHRGRRRRPGRRGRPVRARALGLRRARRRAPLLRDLHRRTSPRTAHLRRPRVLPDGGRDPHGPGTTARCAGHLRRGLARGRQRHRRGAARRRGHPRRP